MTEEETIELNAQRGIETRKRVMSQGGAFTEEISDTLKNNTSGKIFEYVYKFSNWGVEEYFLCPPNAKARYEELRDA